MYLEFLLLIGDYFRTLKRKYLIFEWLIPAICSYIIHFFVKENNILEIGKKISESAITLLGILVGFSITVISLLNTANTPNIDEIKKTMTKYKIGNKTLSLFQLVLINMTYSVVMEVLFIICNLCIPLIWNDFGIYTIKALLCLNIFFILHILLLNLRNMTDFYFILFKKEEKQEEE